MDSFIEHVAARLNERITSHNESRAAVQAELEKVVEKLKAQLDQLKDKLIGTLEEAFAAENERLGRYAREISAKPSVDKEALSKLAEDASAELVVQQTYALEAQAAANDLTGLYKLNVVKSFCGIEERRPVDVSITFNPMSCLDVVRLRFLTAREKQVVAQSGLDNEQDSIVYRAHIAERGADTNSGGNDSDRTQLLVQMDFDGGSGKPDSDDRESLVLTAFLDAYKTYSVRVRAECHEHVTEWSDPVDFTPGFTECCVWKRCPDTVDRDRKYGVLAENPRIAVKTTEGGYCWGTIIGNAALPRESILFWSVRIIKSRGNDGNGIFVGVAPASIDQSVGNNAKSSGWYYDCYTSKLCSEALPSAQRGGYGPNLGSGKYIREEGTVGVVADTARGELSFVVNGVDYGIAFTGIPLDRPLVPCVLIKNKDDAVLLDFAMKSTRPNPAVLAPSGIVQTGSTWDSVTLFWGIVAGAEFYQIESGSAGVLECSETNTYTKRGLLPDTAHSFRIRAVRGGSVSEWSAPVATKTLNQPPFEECSWKKPADRIDGWKGHSVLGKTATKLSGDGSKCLISGSTGFPPNEVLIWGVRVVKSRSGDANGIYVGVTPSDTCQDSDVNPLECGWFLNCYYSTLRSGPPLNLKWKDYGPRKEKGKYVKTGDAIGVVMDMSKRTLSFVLGGIDLGIAFENIPMDKPLVPSVVLENNGDSVELLTRYSHQDTQSKFSFFSKKSIK